MKIHSTFHSIQGEGFFAGIPTFFVRLYGCNLGCSYCDAESAVNGGKWFDKSVLELSKEILENSSKHLLITGGEPLVQEEELSQLIDLIKERKIVSIETNGSLSIKSLRKKFPEIYFSLDWKTPSSGCTDFCLENLDFIDNYGWIKFVAGNEADLLFFSEKYPQIKEKNIPLIISPVFEKGVLWFRHVAEYINKNYCEGDVRLQLQLHKIIGVE